MDDLDIEIWEGKGCREGELYKMYKLEAQWLLT